MMRFEVSYKNSNGQMTRPYTITTEVLGKVGFSIGVYRLECWVDSYVDDAIWAQSSLVIVVS